jgi:hypothetical protein
MMEPDHVDISGFRVRLEKAERRLRAVVIGWVLSVAVLTVLGVGVERANSQLSQLRVHAVELTDLPGRARVKAAAPTDGTAFISLLDEAGRIRLLFLVAADGTPLIAGYDAAGHPIFSSQQFVAPPK